MSQIFRIFISGIFLSLFVVNLSHSDSTVVIRGGLGFHELVEEISFQNGLIQEEDFLDNSISFPANSMEELFVSYRVPFNESGFFTLRKHPRWPGILKFFLSCAKKSDPLTSTGSGFPCTLDSKIRFKFNPEEKCHLVAILTFLGIGPRNIGFNVLWEPAP